MKTKAWAIVITVKDEEFIQIGNSFVYWIYPSKGIAKKALIAMQINAEKMKVSLPDYKIIRVTIH